MANDAGQFDPVAEFEDEPPTNEETYAALRRSIARTAGFGLKFLQCPPSVARETIVRLRGDLSQKRIAVLELEEPIVKLFDRVVEFTKAEGEPDVLFVLGLERSLVEDISPGGVGGEGDYYRTDRTPRILAHVNQNRERFRDSFGFCFVFVLPKFARKYFVRRAADFVDWGSGVFEWRLDREMVDREVLQVYRSGDSDEYLQMSENERREKRVELQTWIEESGDEKQRDDLLFKLGNLLQASQKFSDALICWNLILVINPDCSDAWISRGDALDKLEQHEAAVASYDRALELKPDYDAAWTNRGNALSGLGQYAAAVASYDRALQLTPNLMPAWYNKACCHALQTDLAHALLAFQRAAEINPKCRELATTDTDFDSIRQDPRFQALLNPDRP